MPLDEVTPGPGHRVRCLRAAELPAWSRRQAVTGPTTLQVKLATRFGTAEQSEQSITLRLKGRQETVFVGEFEVK